VQALEDVTDPLCVAHLLDRLSEQARYLRAQGCRDTSISSHQLSLQMYQSPLFRDFDVLAAARLNYRFNSTATGIPSA